MRAALHGITVLDFTTLLPGPLATLLMAEAGAEVIKIERPDGGDDMRGWPPAFDGEGASFALLNRGKRSIALDLKAADARPRLEPLVRRADVLVEQFRPGVMSRLGLGYEDICAINPRLIYCSITGYGQGGPRSDQAGHDLNYLGDSGLLSLGHGTAEAPALPPGLIADIAGGAYPALFNVLLALRRRDLTGEGARLDIAMSEAVMPFCWWAYADLGAAGRLHGSGDHLLTGGSPRYRLYPASDGRLVAVAAIEQKFWLAFTAAIGLDAVLVDDRRDPVATAARIGTLIRSRPSEHWRDVLTRADCCATIVATLEEALADTHFRMRGVYGARVAGRSGASMMALPVPIAPGLRVMPAVAAAPALGADNDLLAGD